MKIVVVGPFQAGKSEYIRKLDNNAINIHTITKNGAKCTIGMDIGNVKIDGIKISLYLFLMGQMQIWMILPSRFLTKSALL
ncbi:MAG: hypothetical protein ACTSRZ_04120 [Promethearchaeota archaeon]